jgi:tetratricopeptide (TPR) repeat protein
MDLMTVSQPNGFTSYASRVTLLALLAGSVWPVPAPAIADVRTLEAIGEYRMGDNDTRTDAKRLALLDAKRLALEQAGTYLEGVTEVRNLKVTRDEIRSYTAGIVEVVEQATRTTLEGETTVVRVDVTVKVDTADVAKQLRELRKNELAKEDLLRAKTEADLLRKELGERNKQLAALTGGAAEAAVQQRQLVLARTDANELVARTWQVPAGAKDDIMTKAKTPTAEELAKYRANLEAALKLDPDNPWAHFKLGHLYHSEGNLDDAIREYRTTIHLKPNEPRPHLALGRALSAQGNKQQAAEEMYAYLMLAEKKPANRPLIERTDKKLREFERRGIRPSRPDRRPFSASR